MERWPSIRASDLDRERVAKRLHAAALEGRISADELGERLGVAYAAMTFGDLDAVITDLPVPAAGAGLATRRMSRLTPARASRRTAMVSLALVVLALDLLVIDRLDTVLNEAHGMSIASVVRVLGLVQVAHVTEAAVGGLCIVLVLIAVVGWARDSGR